MIFMHGQGNVALTVGVCTPPNDPEMGPAPFVAFANQTELLKLVGDMDTADTDSVVKAFDETGAVVFMENHEALNVFASMVYQLLKKTMDFYPSPEEERVH